MLFKLVPLFFVNSSRGNRIPKVVPVQMAVKRPFIKLENVILESSRLSIDAGAQLFGNSNTLNQCFQGALYNDFK